MADPLIKHCRRSGEQFVISPAEIELCQRLGAPLPAEHPRERMRRLTAFNNYFNLFNGACAATGEKIIQMYRPDAPFPVYTVPYWWSDEWDALTFGRGYDFSRDIFSQIKDLRDLVPQPALSVNHVTNENCSFVNGMSYSRNCYLCFLCVNCEDCCYCNSTWRSKDCVDCSSTLDSELCFDCIFASNCYELRHSFNCSGCRESAFLQNCIGCRDCFFCVNLRQAAFCWFNEQLTEEEFRKRKAQIRWDSREELERLRGEFLAFAKKHPQPAIRGASAVDSSGDFLEHCAGAERCFDCSDLEDCFNCFKVAGGKSLYDVYTWGASSEFIYNCSRVGTSASRISCCYLVYSGTADVEYSMNCIGCRDCFACVGLRNKQYCVLNRQYGKDEYFELKKRIIAQMTSQSEVQAGRGYGEYFPYELSNFTYAESDAMYYFPLTEAEAVKLGIPWAPAWPEAERAAALDSGGIPDSASAITDDISNRVFRCPDTGRPFRFSKRELDIYRRRGIALPRKHWKTRIEERARQINLPELYRQNSAKSGLPVTTSFPPDSGWIIWSRQEYEQEISS